MQQPFTPKIMPFKVGMAKQMLFFCYNKKITKYWREGY